MDSIKIYEADFPLCPQLIARLLEIWESAVRDTHTFLQPRHIDEIRTQVGPAIQAMQVVLLAQAEGRLIAFLGLKDAKIEMLFVDAACRGSGLGRRLIERALQSHGARFVDVNEQNTQGVGFYKHLGFVQTSRSALDEEGRPFPILHMEYS